MRKWAIGAVLAAVAGTASAETLVLGGAQLEYRHKEEGGSSNGYLSGYLEGEVMGFYGGAWAEVASDDLMNEVNLYLGYRNATAGGIGYDIGYTRYIYPNDGGDCCGEFTLGLEAPVGPVTGTLDLAHDPSNHLTNAYVGAIWSATNSLDISGEYGVYEVAEAGSEREWELGATYALGETTGVDLRYYDGSDYGDGYFGLALKWDSTLFSR